jgi:hypothetical protein
MGEVIPLFNFSDLSTEFLPRLKLCYACVRVRDNRLRIKFRAQGEPFIPPPPVWLRTIEVLVQDPDHGYISRGRLDGSEVDGLALTLLSGPLDPPLAAHLKLSKNACLTIKSPSAAPLIASFVNEDK